MHTSECARVCMNNEIEPFLGFSLCHYVHKSYISAGSSDFSSSGTIFSVLMCTGELMLCGVSDRAI